MGGVGVEWHKGRGAQQRMFDACDAPPARKTVYVARDWQKVKEYAGFESHELLAECILAMQQAPDGQRRQCCMSELVRHGRKCRLYFDVEWVDQEEHRARGWEKLDALLGAICEEVRERYGVEDARMVVIDGSRPCAPGGFKHSYHLVASNVYFLNNTGGMKSFVERLAQRTRADPLLTWTDPKTGAVRSIIDEGVYTKNRIFRTAGSTKWNDATNTPLVRIVRDPDGRWQPQPYASVEAMLESFVTYVPDGAIVVSCGGDGREAKRKRKKQGAEVDGAPRKCRTAQPTVQQEVGAEETQRREKLLHSMQKFVRRRNIPGLLVVAFLRTTTLSSHLYSCRNDGTRPCLVNSHETHVSNNAYLREDVDGYVYYYCLAPECRKYDAWQIVGNIRRA